MSRVRVRVGVRDRVRVMGTREVGLGEEQESSPNPSLKPQPKH